MKTFLLALVTAVLLPVVTLLPTMAASAATGQSITMTGLDKGSLGSSSCSDCDSNGVRNYTLGMTCNNGDCTYGQYVTGDYWILDPNCSSTTNENSVRFVSETPSARSASGRTINGIMRNPEVPGRSTITANGWDSRVSGYSSGLNILADGSYYANADGLGAVSYVKALSINPASATCPDNGSSSNAFCIHSYFVVTIVCEQPPADAWRPPYTYDDKPAQSYGTDPDWRENNVDYSFIPTFNVLGMSGSITLQEALDAVVKPQVDIVRSPGGSNQRLISVVNSGPAVYGGDLAFTRSRSALLMVDDSTFASGTPNRRDLVRAWIQFGIDTAGTVLGVLDADPDDEGIWLPAGGHGSGRKLPIVVAAYFLNDSMLRDLILTVVDDTLDGNKMFSEDAMTYWSEETVGGDRALFGELCAEGAGWQGAGSVAGNCARWWTDGQVSEANEYCRDPAGLVDGGNWRSLYSIGGGYSYVLTSTNGAALLQRFFPQLNELWGHDPYALVMDRLEGYETFGGDSDEPGGFWADDDANNTQEPISSGECTSPPYYTQGTGRVCTGTSTTCESQHTTEGRGAYGSYVSAFVEVGYVDPGGSNVGMRRCADTPTAPDCTGYIGLKCGDRLTGTVYCTGPGCDVDFDDDGIDDCDDSCPTIDNSGTDTDADGVDDVCDTCKLQANPQVTSLASGRTYVSRQRDDDADGRGNRCDFDYDQAGASITAGDWNNMNSANTVANFVADSDCGTSGALPCDIFDHNEGGLVITAGPGGDHTLCHDAVLAGGVINTNFPKCTACSPPFSDPIGGGDVDEGEVICEGADCP